MQQLELPIENINVEKLVEMQGEFENEKGQRFPYKSYTIHFTIGTYPLIFKAKLDKTLKDYVNEAYKE